MARCLWARLRLCIPICTMRLYFARGRNHLRAFENVVAGGLLAVDVLARLAGPNGGQRMPVVGRGDGDRVDVLVFEHLPQILVDLRLGPLQVLDDFGGALGLRGVYVTKRHHARIRQLAVIFEVVAAAAADAYNPYADLIIRAGRTAGAQRQTGAK